MQVDDPRQIKQGDHVTRNPKPALEVCCEPHVYGGMLCKSRGCGWNSGFEQWADLMKRFMVRSGCLQTIDSHLRAINRLEPIAEASGTCIWPTME